MNNVVSVISLIIGITSILALLVYINKVKKYQKMYENSLAKFNNTANVKDKFVDLFARLDEVEKICGETKEYCKGIDDKSNNNISKIGLVKYNAYDDSDSKLSFSLAVLDNNNKGILINHIHSIHGSNIYIKQVIDGKVKERISEEEARAIDDAISSKGELIEKETTALEVKKVNTKALNRLRK